MNSPFLYTPSDARIHMVEVKYELHPDIVITVRRRAATDSWLVSMSDALEDERGQFKLMDGTKAGGLYCARQDAEAEVQRIINYYSTVLTPAEIKRHFKTERICCKEQSELLFLFRDALLRKHLIFACFIYEYFNASTRDFIPDKVRWHLQYAFYSASPAHKKQLKSYHEDMRSGRFIQRVKDLLHGNPRIPAHEKKPILKHIRAMIASQKQK